MTEYYRFRSMDRLIRGDSPELESQTIFFASPEQLNDPMEGLRDVFWHGDKIVWANLFKNYVYCLHQTYAGVKVAGNDFKIGRDFIPFWGRWDLLDNAHAEELFNVCWDRVRRRPNLDKLIDIVGKANRRVRLSELLVILNSAHLAIFSEIQGVHIERCLEPEPERPQHEGRLAALSASDRILNELLERIELKPEEFSQVAPSLVVRTLSEVYLNHKYQRRNSEHEALEHNRQLLLVDFPEAYLEQLQRLLWPQWYAACFSRSYHNSSLWGHYADSHKGACLIFDAVESDESNSLALNQVVGWSFNPQDGEQNTKENWDFAPMPFRDISYADNVGEVDFFRSIGRLPVGALLNLWYTDDDGNESECASHITQGGIHEENWRNTHWDGFFRDITAKTNDWEYEQEGRLILYGLLDDELEERQRKLTYEFNSLKGIIFGIRTPRDDKLRVIEIIEEKCRKEGRTGFKFFQAYYSPKDGDVRRAEINLEFPGIANSSGDADP